MEKSDRPPELETLPLDWPGFRVDDIFEIQQGKQVSRKNRVGENQQQFLRTKNVMWGRLDLSELDLMHFTESDEQRLALRNGDLLLCEGGWVGRTAIWWGEVERCYYQNHLHRLRVIDGQADPMFGLYWFWYAFEFGNVYFGRKNVTTIPNMSKSRLGGLPMPIPPLPEQRSIAAVLSLVQRAIEQEERLISLTSELKKTLMDKLFTEGTRGEPQKQTEIGPIPESWQLVELGNVVDFFNGYAFRSSEAVDISNTQLVRMGNLYQNTLDLSRKPMFFPDDYGEIYSKFVLKAGDLIMSLTGTSGKEDYGFTVEINSVSQTLLLNQRVTRIDIKTTKIIKPFILYFLLSRKFLDYLYPTAKGMKQANLSTHAMKKLKIVIPNKDEQQEITDCFLSIDRKVAMHEKRREGLLSMFTSLLYQLMTAEIRLNHFDLAELGVEVGEEEAEAV